MAVSPESVLPRPRPGAHATYVCRGRPSPDDDPGGDEGRHPAAYARGLHNSIDFDWDAQTGLMWTGETGQDNLGDDFPPDEIDLVEDGAHYGFPFFIAANRLNVGQPELEGKIPTVGSKISPRAF